MGKRDRQIRDESDGEENGIANGDTIPATPAAASQPVIDDGEELYEQEPDDEDEDENEDDLDAPAGREVSEAGIIEQVHLENFMCHKQFTMDFGRNINFIVGENGSGKSAVLVALSVCLGAKIAQTNRASKLSDLILNHGTYRPSSALVRVTLRNRGSEAYQRDKFGDKIIVERRITRDGASQFKLKNDRSHTVYTSLKELELVLEQFNIQINNPCAILMQDTSREFLTQTKGTKLYEFFLKATQLDDIQRSFISTNDNLQQMKIQIAKNRKQLPDMRTEFEKIEREYSGLQELEKMQRHQTQLKAMMAWALLKEAEEDHKAKAKVVDKLKKESDRLEQLLADIQGNKAGAHEAVNAREREANALEREIHQLRVDLEKISEEMANANKAARAAATAVRNVEKNLGNFRTRRQNIDNSIAESKAKAARTNDEEKRARQAEIRGLEERRAALIESKDANERRKADLEQQIGQLNGQISHLDRDADRYKRDREQAQRQVQQLESRTADRLSVYGPRVSQLVRLVEARANQFRKKPLGPIGAYMKVRDPRWFVAVEACLTSRILNAFVLDNLEDRNLLMKLAREAGMGNFPVFVQQFEPKFQVPAKTHRFDTVLSVLTVDDDQVYNAVVNQASPEEKILIENPDEARSVIFDGRGKPNNVTEAFLPDGSKLNKRKTTNNYIAYRDPRYYFKADTSAQVEEGKRRMADAQERVRGLQEQRDALNHQLSTLRRDSGAVERAISKDLGPISRIKRDIDDLQRAQEQQDTVHIEAEIKEQEEARTKIDHQIEASEKDLEKAQKGEILAADKLKPYELRKRQADEKLDGVVAKHDEIMESVKEAGGTLQDITTKENQLKSQLNKRTADHTAAVAARDQSKEKEETTRVKVLRISEERIDTDKTVAQIEDEIRAVTRRIEHDQASRKKSSEELKREYQEAKAKWEAVNTEIEDAENNSHRLRDALNNRDGLMKKLRSSIAKRTAYLFNAHLSKRGYAGLLTFDHKAATLEIDVNTENATSASQRPSETRGLSGGERSFSTVSLLLSLWEAMETPFRAMDEFDVFMDAVNRRVSIDMIISSCRLYPSRQFIFITPQGYQAIASYSGPDLTVHRMHPPDRNQGTLGFAPEESQS
eukprot:TRINITY_DN23213_c0_g1_i1.p1 TRINITY_DN23213_c0_g1~~TRINITY_DN23213_c0_g1_i1.p1  ORF type:complete len:1122 (-),score=470.20 TRINITY_DN23213_c0_g1_i1:139-3504(-)